MTSDKSPVNYKVFPFNRFGFDSIIIGGSLEPKAIPLMHLEESVLLQCSGSPT